VQLSSKMRRALLSSFAMLALGAAGAQAQSPEPTSLTKTSGAVTATLSWTPDETGFPASPHLTVVRDGQTVVDRALDKECQGCRLVIDTERGLTVADLDGDGEPEVLTDLFSGGAHCCTTALVWYRKADGTYVRRVRAFGNSGYVVEDIDKDGTLELRSDDDRFAYEFAAYAFSLRPIQVLKWRGHKLVNVTRSFPAQIRAESREALKAVAEQRKGGEPRGAAAAYVADLVLLGQSKKAFAWLDRALARGDLDGGLGGTESHKAYRAHLVGFLRKTGYLRSAGKAQAQPDPAPTSVTKTAGNVTATLSWTPDEFGFPKQPHLVIARDGVTVLDRSIARECLGCESVTDTGGGSLTVTDVDGDGEPEVLTDLYTGGAHCCTNLLIWYLRDGAYVRKAHNFGNAGYVLRDLDKDGRPELLTDDDSFSYTFAAYAYSIRPIQVYTFTAGTLTDTTRRFGRAIRNDMRMILATLPDLRTDKQAQSGVAAYAADLLLLGKRKEALAYIDRAIARGDVQGDGWIWPSRKTFRHDLLKFLRAQGYLKS
jgi:hypothetical protein